MEVGGTSRAPGKAPPRVKNGIEAIEVENYDIEALQGHMFYVTGDREPSLLENR
jgi:hypothetical protein